MSRDRDSSRRSAPGAKADRILEQALTHELKGAGTPPAGACLDAETLAAWTDGGLDPAAMVAAETHVSNCARCQAMVGTLIHSATTLDTSGALGRLGTADRSWWKWWLAPIAAGVTAVTLWMVVPEQSQVAVAPPQAEITSAAPPAPTATEAAPPTRDQKAAREPAKERDNFAAAARADRAPLRDAAAPKQEDASRMAGTVAGQRQEAQPAAPAVPPPAAAALEAPAAALQKSARNAVAPIEVLTLDGSRRWRILADRIERTDDGGTTWTVTGEVPLGQAIVAGSAPAVSVGWFAGTRGLVLLTTDAGVTFTNVSLAEPLDIASISATDARSASVSTVSGRRFRTDDGGRTWRSF